MNTDSTCTYPGCDAPGASYIPQEGSPLYDVTLSAQADARVFVYCPAHVKTKMPMRPV